MKVKQLQLTKGIFVPTVGQLPATIGTIHCPAEMSAESNGIRCTAKGGTFLIPYSMVECAVIDSQPEEAKSNAKAPAKKA
jgi:hypothetical protein